MGTYVIKTISGRRYIYYAWNEKVEGKWKAKTRYVRPLLRRSKRLGVPGQFVKMGLKLAFEKQPKPKDDQQLLAYPKHMDPWDRQRRGMSDENWGIYIDHLKGAKEVLPHDLAEHVARKEFHQVIEKNRIEDAAQLEIEEFATEHPGALREIFAPHLSEEQTLSAPALSEEPEMGLEAAPQLDLGLHVSPADDVQDASPSEPEIDASPEPDASEGSDGQDAPDVL